MPLWSLAVVLHILFIFEKGEVMSSRIFIHAVTTSLLAVAMATMFSTHVLARASRSGNALARTCMEKARAAERARGVVVALAVIDTCLSSAPN